MSDDKKLPGLDGLRAIAVAMVLLFHQGALLMGWIGVQAFFVLSGYLITGLLASQPRHIFAISMGAAHCASSPCTTR